MATNKKITQLDELTPATWADDDVIAIVDISAQETKKIQLSTFRGAVTGVSSLNASTPLTVDSATGDVTISVAINGGGTINAVFDEDNMASNSPTALATQQSIKAYVDSQVGTVDTLAEILANGNTSGGTNIVVSSGDVITTNTINETTAAAGVTIDSVLVKDGQVDGRDVSVDGTKLDTVETNADVTDTANVTAAGALMDSELTNITAVKALNQGVATTDTPTFAGLVTAGNVDGRDVSVDGAKLDGIEAGADVTDATNVTAAGALMDSELTNIAAVKALDQGVATGDSPSFAGLTATTADINGGTIDGTVIGGSSAAAGTFTTFTSTGIDDNAASNALTIDSSGNVGIGTASPDSALHVYKQTNDRSARFQRLSSQYMDIGQTSGVNEIKSTGKNFEIGTTDALDFIIDTSGSERMRIDSSGNVGIGTSAPSTKVEISTNNETSVLRLTDTATIGAVDRKVGGVEFYQNDASGGAGIGSSIEAYHVNISGDTDLRFATGDNTERMRINSSGNVGIGTSSPSTLLHLASTGNAILTLEADTDNVTESDNARIELSQDGGATTGHLGYGSGTNGIDVWNDYSDYVRIGTNNAERLRVTNAGNLLVGQTSDSSPGFNDTNTGGAWSSDGTSLHLSRDSNAVAWLNRNTTTGTIQSFRYEGSAVGSVSVTASATAFNTSSDYRLKENVVAIDGAIDRVKLLKPSRFNFIADPDTTVDGFVAHEVSDIVPEAVHGEKDAVDADGNPEYQGIDQSKLVPVLTAALQEALTKIEALEARIVALETA